MLMPLPNVAVMSVAPNDSILMQFDIRVVGTTEALGRQPKVVSQIKPHEHSALVGGPPSFLIGATLEHPLLG
jgi:hypothetical protein